MRASRSGYFESLLITETEESAEGHRHIIDHDGKIWSIVLHGKGKILFESGVEAEGDFHYDSLHGRGRYKYENGITYDGHMENWNASGEGLLIFPDQSVLRGSFTQDCPIEGRLTLPGGPCFYVKYDGKTGIAEVKRRAAPPASARWRHSQTHQACCLWNCQPSYCVCACKALCPQFFATS
jgi:hypothetical protein